MNVSGPMVEDRLRRVLALTIVTGALLGACLPPSVPPAPRAGDRSGTDPQVTGGPAGTQVAPASPDTNAGCMREDIGAPSPASYCIELLSVPEFPRASGTAELRRVAGPFGVTVSPGGAHLHDVAFDLRGLPDPASLGPFTTYVAWATSPMLDLSVKLGPVAEGRTVAGRVALDQFIIMVSAESAPGVATRSGRIVLRGMSPSMQMVPHGAAKLPGVATGPHAHHDDASGWRMPPMHPAVTSMIPGLEPLRPRVDPFVAGRGIHLLSLPEVLPRRLVSLGDGDTMALEARIVRRTIGGRVVAMYGFNGQHPGPLIHARERATVVVDFTNRIDMPTSVHWHGIRLDNRFDGVPHVTQELVPPGGTFRYVLHFPDPGIYWYHPHHREDIQQDLGLYGNIMVQPDEAGYWSPVNREEILMVDDLLVDDAGLIPYGASHATHALMGRFGNRFLVNGDSAWTTTVNRGDVVRFYLTNVANTRPFNISVGDHPLKVVASDVGKYERESWATNVAIAPAERYVVEARFDTPGTVALVNRVHAIDHTQGRFFPETDTLGVITVLPARSEADHSAEFATLRSNSDVIADIDRYRAEFDRAVDKDLLLTLRTRDLPYGLLQVLRLDTAYVNPVEWSGTMPMMDWLSTGREVEWVLRDARTGKENMEIDWRFSLGDIVKLRLTNDRHTLHPMQHPIHIHGQRFLVLSQNGVPNDNLVWKDTVLLPVGSTAEILLELSNPGKWMLHCHIAEHLETGMHAVFTVSP